MNYGLKKETINKINTVFSRFPQLETVILYGSRARGNFKPGSDIDLTLKGTDLDLRLLNKIDIELDDLLLPYTIDLSIYSHIDNPDLLDHIKNIGTVFYSRHSE